MTLARIRVRDPRTRLCRGAPAAAALIADMTATLSRDHADAAIAAGARPRPAPSADAL